MVIAPATAATAAGRAAPAGPCSSRTFGTALRQHAYELAQPPPPASATRAVLDAVERSRKHLESVLAAARRGQTFTPQELLLVQADAYRYSQTVEVASKLVEHAAQSVKNAINTNV